MPRTVPPGRRAPVRIALPPIRVRSPATRPEPPGHGEPDTPRLRCGALHCGSGRSVRCGVTREESMRVPGPPSHQAWSNRRHVCDEQ